MQHIFVSNISEKQQLDIIDLYKSFSIISIEQYPGWAIINNPQKKIVYYLCYNNDVLIGYAVIIEKFKIASIYFGPVFKDVHQLSLGFLKIYEHYKNIFAKISIKLPYLNDKEVLNLEQKLESIIKLKYNNNQNENWSTLRIDLSKTLEKIRSSYSLNHKRCIKKAINLGIEVRTLKNISEVETFSGIYNNLYKSRNLVKSFGNSKEVFSEIWNFFDANQNGDFLGVFLNQQLIGGLVFVKQQQTIYYQYGASEVGIRNLPILHLGFDFAIEQYKNRGVQFFDFGGFPINIDKSDQIFNINRFKKGFGGEILIYPSTITIPTNIFLESILDLAKKTRNKLFRS